MGERAYDNFAKQTQTLPNYAELAQQADAELEIATQLVEARRKANLTQAELAKRMGIHQSQISRLEREGNTLYEIFTVQRYLAALGTGYKVKIVIESPMRNAQS